MEWNNDLVFEFLTLYEGESALWDSKNLQHKNRNDIHDAWTRIQRALKDGSVALKEIKTKKDNLMSTYRKLRSRVKGSMTTGSGAGDIFKPDWPFYYVMSAFLDDIYQPRKTKNSNNLDENEESMADHEIYVTDEGDDASENIVAFKAPTNASKRSKSSKANVNETERRMEEAYNYMKRMSEKPEDDESSLYCNLLCKKLRGLQENTREMAMLEIDKYLLHLKQNENRNQFPQLQTSFYHPQIFPTPQHPHYFSQATPTITSQRSPNFQPSSATMQNRNNDSQQSPGFQPYRYPQPSPQPYSYSQASSLASFLQPSLFPQPSPFPQLSSATMQNSNNYLQPQQSPRFQPHHYPQEPPSPQLSHSPQPSPSSQSSQTMTQSSNHSQQSSTQDSETQESEAQNLFKLDYEAQNIFNKI